MKAERTPAAEHETPFLTATWREHPPWRLSLNAECLFEADIRTIDGKRFAQPLERAPVSTFVADGSDVVVYRGRPVQAS